MSNREIAPWGWALGAARSTLALGTLVTLLATPPEVLFRPLGIGLVDRSPGIFAYTYFSLLSGHLELARWIAIAFLLVVIAGWRPRWTCIPHWWITASLTTMTILTDGGDQLASVLTLILIPALLADPRHWHWQRAPNPERVSELVTSRLARWSIRLARLQVAVMYLHAATGKFTGREWQNGTAIYYWLLDTRIGFPESHHSVVVRMLESPHVTVALTWMPIILELALFTVLVMPAGSPARRVLFVLGAIFHAGNVVFFGLVSFFFSTMSALTLLCWPSQWRPATGAFWRSQNADAVQPVQPRAFEPAVVPVPSSIASPASPPAATR